MHIVERGELHGIPCVGNRHNEFGEIRFWEFARNAFALAPLTNPLDELVMLGLRIFG